MGEWTYLHVFKEAFGVVVSYVYPVLYIPRLLVSQSGLAHNGIIEYFALNIKEGSVDSCSLRAFPSKELHVLGGQPLEEGRRIGPLDGQHRAIGEVVNPACLIQRLSAHLTYALSFNACIYLVVIWG